METAWLIEIKREHDSAPLFLGIYSYGITKGFSPESDVNKALRFSRKQDAEQMLSYLIWLYRGRTAWVNALKKAVITEHAWAAVPRATTEDGFP